MYYGLIMLSVILFGVCFAAKDMYRKHQGNSVKNSLKFTLISSVAGLAALVAINGFKFEITAFTFVMALLASVNGFGFTFCSFKALGKINLSLYSLFSMLGGMALPFFQGILFYGEDITGAKIICVILICIALLLTVVRGEKRKGTIYYVGIFVLNGMSGVLSKLFSSLPFEKTSAEGYSILISVFSIVLSFIILAVFFRDKNGDNKIHLKAIGIGAFSGVANKIANLWLVIALSHVDVSVQYPMVTGGTMIVSTVICLLGENKPSKKEIVSVIIAFMAMLALFAVPF